MCGSIVSKVTLHIVCIADRNGDNPADGRTDGRTVVAKRSNSACLARSYSAAITTKCQSYYGVSVPATKVYWKAWLLVLSDSHIRVWLFEIWPFILSGERSFLFFEMLSTHTSGTQHLSHSVISIKNLIIIGTVKI